MPQLRELSWATRLGVTALLGVLALGMWTSLRHMQMHHGVKDGKEGLSKEDLLGSYHPIEKPAPLLAALEQGHPEGLEPGDRQILLEWLESPRERISDDYESLDRWDFPPYEVIELACLDCHMAGASEGDGIGEAVPLDSWAGVQAVAYGVEVRPPAEEILFASAHTHALSLGCLGLVLIMLLSATRFGRGLGAGIAALMGLSLLGDLGSWFLAREHADYAFVVIISGGLFAATVMVALLLVLLDLWLPLKRGSQ